MTLKDIGPGFRRKRRSPSFPLAGIQSPFGLYPIAAFPLLAGETLESLTMAGRFISMPVKHPIMGAWLEQWVVAVPARLALSEAVVTDIAPSTVGLTAGADRPRFFTKSGALDTIKRAYDLVVDEFFEAPGSANPTVDGVAQLPRMGVDWTENLQPKPASGDPTKWPIANVTEELTGMDLETERQLIQATTYRDWQQQFGVSDPKSQSRPIMLRYDRDWTLPQNVIDPASGVPRSAFFWDRKFSMGKRFRAKEHSIILVLSAWRPLMLNALTVASYLQRMSGLKEWLPPHNEGAWDTIGADDAIFAAAFDTDNTTLVYDKSDVWARGETFVNCAAADSPYPPYVSANSLESAGVDSQRGKFPSTAEVDAIFVGSTAPSKVVHYQAMCLARILGYVREVRDVA